MMRPPFLSGLGVLEVLFAGMGMVAGGGSVGMLIVLDDLSC